MALTPATASANFATAHSTVDKSNKTAVIAAFVDTYDTHAKAAVGTTITITGAGKAAMQTKLETVTSSVVTNQDIFAQALADYWGAETTPQAPYTIYVSNTASTKVAAFKAALAGSLTTNVTNAKIEQFFTDTDVVVKTITWSCKVSGESGPVAAGVT